MHGEAPLETGVDDEGAAVERDSLARSDQPAAAPLGPVRLVGGLPTTVLHTEVEAIRLVAETDIMASGVLQSVQGLLHRCVPAFGAIAIPVDPWHDVSPVGMFAVWSAIGVLLLRNASSRDAQWIGQSSGSVSR